MIISEKQIMSLIRLIELSIRDEFEGSSKGAQTLIDKIYNQQSEELKVIE